MSDKWKHKQGTGLWAEYVHEDTGESTLKEHKPKVIWESCPPYKCYYELTNSAERECTCRKCGAKVRFVLGIQILQNGKIVSIR